jgi:hypothetical protein
MRQIRLGPSVTRIQNLCVPLTSNSTGSPLIGWIANHVNKFVTVYATGLTRLQNGDDLAHTLKLVLFVVLVIEFLG